MLQNLYYNYGIWPFVMVVMLLVVLLQRLINKSNKKRIDNLEKLYRESEDKQKKEREINANLAEEIERNSEYYKAELSKQSEEHKKQVFEIRQKHVSDKTTNTARHNNEINELKKKLSDSEIKHEIELKEQEEAFEHRITELSRQYAYDKNAIKKQLDETTARYQNDISDKDRLISEQSLELQNRNSVFEHIMQGNLKAMPYLAGLMSDYLTYDLEVLANQLDWGDNKKRRETEIKIRELRNTTKEKLEAAKEAEYQLAYLKELYPELEDIIDTDCSELFEKPSLEKLVSSEEDTEIDSTRSYLSPDEWRSLSVTERNQLALERYIEGRKKSKWQIGRDYELSVGYSMYEKNGWDVSYFGTEKKLEDLGRDLIAKKGMITEIVQCKYWGKEKTIHEKHIFQLYGTKVCYESEHKSDGTAVKAKFVTNIKLSNKAKEIADILGIDVEEEYPMQDFPRIKCNIGKDVNGRTTKIYHLPMDQQYDNVVIDKGKGEMLVKTVKEAEKAGFRRAYKWHM